MIILLLGLRILIQMFVRILKLRYLKINYMFLFNNETIDRKIKCEFRQIESGFLGGLFFLYSLYM